MGELKLILSFSAEDLYVSGNIDALGNFDPDRAVLMSSGGASKRSFFGRLRSRAMESFSGK